MLNLWGKGNIQGLIVALRNKISKIGLEEDVLRINTFNLI